MKINGVKVAEITDLTEWVNSGGDVETIEDMSIYLRMPLSEVDNQVKAGMPNRTYLDSEENKVVRKWEEWNNTICTKPFFNVAGTECIVRCQGYNRCLTGKEINILLDAGYNLLTLDQYRALVQTPEWDKEKQL